MNALEIKHAVMYYFRFKRQWICGSECFDNDVMVFTGKMVLEIEVKVSKSDLWHGEAKKSKHGSYKLVTGFNVGWIPNKFYIAVPETLSQEAEKWVEATNSKYGILICSPYCRGYPLDIIISRTAKLLHGAEPTTCREKIFSRVCAENISFIEKILTKPPSQLKRRNNGYKGSSKNCQRITNGTYSK